MAHRQHPCGLPLDCLSNGQSSLLLTESALALDTGAIHPFGASTRRTAP